MSELSHLWQRFLLTSSLLVGIAIGATATIFGASNQASVNVTWWVFHLNGVPLWTVAVVPLAVVLVTGTIYHWMDGLHHFTEHMRHRRRVHELETEVASLRAHLDRILEMPDHSDSSVSPKRAAASLPPAAEGPAEPAPAETVEMTEAPRPEPVHAEPAAGDEASAEKPSTEPQPAKADGRGKTKTPRIRGSLRKRALLEEAGASGKENGLAKKAVVVEASEKDDAAMPGV